jgi:hypothetical protein
MKEGFDTGQVFNLWRMARDTCMVDLNLTILTLAYKERSHPLFIF